MGRKTYKSTGFGRFTKGNSIAGGLVDPSFKGATIIVVGFEINFSYWLRPWGYSSRTWNLLD